MTRLGWESRVKTRPLPDIDLARIAPLPRDLQRRQLEQIRYGRPPFSYGPLRSSFYDIFNIQPAMFGPVKPTDWTIVQTILARKCKSPDELVANLRVAKGLHQYVAEGEITGRAQDFFPMAMSAGRKVVYWLSMILILEDRPVVPFIDPRRSRGLTKKGRRFVFSMMHERIRAADPDYANVGLAILQFGDVDNNIRHPVLHTDDGVELFSLGEMEEMVLATYKLWQEVCEELEVETHRKAHGLRGSLL